MSYKDDSYYRKFPQDWIYFLRSELTKEFPEYESDRLLSGYLPPVSKSSIIGKIAARFPSRPEGITIAGVIYLTHHYDRVRNLYDAASGAKAAKIYEFGMYAHETYHAIDQELTKDFPLLKRSGRWKWFIKYVARLIKTPNAYKHPMEKPAYSFQKRMKSLAQYPDFMES
jgi:hypothetical protein|tara:strand:+ start:1469 stop:1978 length:510 start_codon:yes stop_codon:yes gene_type:complete